jgi:hypothetical protein
MKKKETKRTRKEVVADFKKHFQPEPEQIKWTLREKLVGNIMYYSGDEYEDRNSVLNLAMESEDQLVDRIINILDYYYDQAQ